MQIFSCASSKINPFELEIFLIFLQKKFPENYLSFSFQKKISEIIFRKKIPARIKKNPVPVTGSQRRKPPLKASFRAPRFQDRQPSQSGPSTGSVSPEFRNRAQIGLRLGSDTPLFGAKLLVDSHEHRVRQIITILHQPGACNPGTPEISKNSYEFSRRPKGLLLLRV